MSDLEELDLNRFLVFRLGTYKYACPLLDSREVLEPVSYNEVPNTESYFEGICNIRGEVVGIIDLRKMLNINPEIHRRNAVIVFDSNEGSLGGIVDEIVSVLTIPEEDIDRQPHIKSSVDNKYIKGIAKVNNELLTILNLERILNEDVLMTMRNLK